MSPFKKERADLLTGPLKESRLPKLGVTQLDTDLLYMQPPPGPLYINLMGLGKQGELT